MLCVWESVCVCEVCVCEVCVQFVSDALNFELCLYVVHGTGRQLAVIVIGINMLEQMLRVSSEPDTVVSR